MRHDGLSACLSAFYTAHKQELFTYALSITHSAVCAEDAIQEAFIGILESNRKPAELRPYVFRCIRNAALDAMRAAERERRKRDGFQSIFQEETPSAYQEMAAEFLADLPEADREIVVLKVYSGLTFKEIAETCESRQGTIASRYWRSLRKLRESLCKNGTRETGAEEQRS